jgi:Rrf2 family protein
MHVLAERYGQGLTRTVEIAERNGLSPHYLEQLFLLLRRARLVKSKRGKLGGFELAHSPESISILDIVEALDGSLALLPCPMGVECCHQPTRCAWHDVCEEAHNALCMYFKQVNLAQLLERQHKKQAAYPSCQKYPHEIPLSEHHTTF